MEKVRQLGLQEQRLLKSHRILLPGNTMRP